MPNVHEVRESSPPLNVFLYGRLNGYGTPEQHVARAAELGMGAMALTEHGNVSSHVKLEQAGQKYGVKPIFGLEAYTGPIDMRENKNRRKWHLTLLAMDDLGYRNLMRLVTRSWAEGFYQWPTISGPMLADHHEGLIVLSGCADSKLSCDLLGGKGREHGDEQDAHRTIESFKDLLGDRYYLECQQFPELDRSCQLNGWLAGAARRHGVPLVGTADVHYPHPDDNEMQVVLHAAGRGAGTVAQAEAEWEYGIRLTHPLSDKFILRRLQGTGLTVAQAQGAVLASSDIAGRCTVELPKVERLRYPLEKGMTASETVWAWLREGWHYRVRMNPRLKAEQAAYVKRLKYEMELIEGKDFLDYFLMLSDIVRWSKDNGIPVGPARGSAAASLTCYLLRITEIDPLQFPVMLFERFIDLNRRDLPDVDLDFDDERRDEVRDYAKRKYGEDRVANIGTFTKYRGKNALIDVARVHNIPDWKIKVIKDLVVERSGGDSRVDASLGDTMEMFPQAKAVFDEFPDLHKAIRLEGNYRGMGVHAAGLVISNDPLTDNVASYTKEVKGKESRSVLSVDKYDAEYLGLMKADFLGLTTMGMLRRALAMIEMSLEELYAVTLDDPEVIGAFHANDVTGIFQFGGGATRVVNGDVKPDNFMELCDINALSRPGPLHSGSTNDYIAVKHGRMQPDHLHPVIDELTKDTKYQIIYQEQILQIIRELGGLPWTHIQEIRKIISLKKGEGAFNERRQDFIDGCGERYQIDPKQALKIWNKLVTAGQYAFCMTGETVLTKGGANQHSKSRTVTLRELYELQQKHTINWWNYHSPKVQQMDDDGRIRPRKIFWIDHPVDRDIIRVETASGRVLRMSPEHRLLSTDGYLLATDLRIGMELVAMGEHFVPEYVGVRTDRAKGKSYSGKGTPVGDNNPAWIDGRTGLLARVKKVVEDRSRRCCEHCQAAGRNTSHSLEFAHILSLDDLGGNYKKYHSDMNILHLCNSCHKKFDYAKGERVSRDTRGRPTVTDEITSIRPDGEDLVYDVHMDSTGHNYIGDGIVQHNNAAHCVSYSMLAYWCMWFKVHHTEVFYAASLQKVDKDDTRYLLLRDAIRHGIKILPPDLDRSGVTWDRTEDGVLAGFLQVPGVGEVLAGSILEEREREPFGTWDDLLRVKGIGPTMMEKITSMAASDDPFKIYVVDWLLNDIRAELVDGGMGPLPIPTHKATEIPTDAQRNLPLVWVGIPKARNPQDVLEDERARSGDDIDVCRKRMGLKVGDPVKKMAVVAVDDTDESVYLRFSRRDFPRFEKALWSMKLNTDVVLVRGERLSMVMGRNIQVKQMWVITP